MCAKVCFCRFRGKVLGPPKDPHQLNSTSGVSDILSLVGTIFLWLFWPSFNGGAFTADPIQGGRAITNTVVGLLGSCTCTFLVSGIIGGKLTPADIQNATLAGGVAVGAIARMNIGLGWASVIGSAGGIISTLGYQYIQPFLERKIGLYDTCGVNNLHGLPGIFGSVMAIIFANTAWESWMPWPKDEIALYQLYTLLVTLARDGSGVWRRHGLHLQVVQARHQEDQRSAGAPDPGRPRRLSSLQRLLVSSRPLSHSAVARALTLCLFAYMRTWLAH